MRTCSEPRCGLPPGTVVQITESVISITQWYFTSLFRGRRSHEEVVYWAGVSPDYRTKLVTTIVTPKSENTRGSFRTSAGENARVIASLAKNGLVLLGQVHTHPGRYVDHSRGDSLGALMPYEGFFSIVVGNYCRFGMLPLHECGVYVFAGGEFAPVPKHCCDVHFPVVPSLINLRS